MVKTACISLLVLVLFSCNQEKPTALNLELKKELAEMWFADQAFRTMTNKTTGDTIKILSERMKVDSVYLKNNFISVLARSDSENSKRIEEIIKDYGYPGKSLAGTPENKTAWIIIQHSDAKTIEKYLPLLRDAAKKGDIEKTALALTEDRNLMYQGKVQIYGSQGSSYYKNGKSIDIMWPIQNPEKVNDRREEAGFHQTVEEYAKNLYGKDFVYKNYGLEEVKKQQEENLKQ